MPGVRTPYVGKRIPRKVEGVKQVLHEFNESGNWFETVKKKARAYDESIAKRKVDLLQKARVGDEEAIQTLKAEFNLTFILPVNPPVRHRTQVVEESLNGTIPGAG